MVEDTSTGFGKGLAMGGRGHDSGRWPANLIHDGSDEVLALFPETGASKSGGKSGSNANPMSWDERNEFRPRVGHDDNGGSAARFFYCAKTSKKDRNEGLDDFTPKASGILDVRPSGDFHERLGGKAVQPRANTHPTVKPTDLMRYLCRLVTPPGGTVLDPFMGSGSTGKAAMLEGFAFVGIEMDETYHTIAKARIDAAAVSLFVDIL